MYGVCGSYVTWLTFTGYIGQPGCNYAYGNWSNSIPNGGGFGDDDPYPPVGTAALFAKPVDVPDGETSAIPSPTAWNPNRAAPWNQTLAGGLSPSEFEGRGIYEYGATGGTDTCWFAKSKFVPFTSITTPGFGWPVSSKNIWGTDWIGWNLAPVQYYRTQGKVPCGASFQQIVVADAAYDSGNTPAYSSYLNEDGDLFYGVPYETRGRILYSFPARCRVSFVPDTWPVSCESE